MKNLNFTNFYSYFVGEEIEFLKKIKNLKNGNYFLIIQPIFLFKGYLQNKNLVFFSKFNGMSHHVLDNLMTIDDIQNLIVKKLKGIFLINN